MKKGVMELDQARVCRDRSDEGAPRAGPASSPRPSGGKAKDQRGSRQRHEVGLGQESEVDYPDDHPGGRPGEFRVLRYMM